MLRLLNWFSEVIIELILIRLSPGTRGRQEREREIEMQKNVKGQSLVAHDFNPNTLEAEKGRALSLRPDRSTEWVSEHPEIQRNPISEKQKEGERKREKERETLNPWKAGVS